MSLEVDAAKNGHLFPLYQVQEEKVAHSNDSSLTSTPQQTAYQYGTPQQTASQHGAPQHTLLPNVHQIDGRLEPADARISKLRRINIWLLTAFISSLVLAIIAAAVGGSLAVNRQNQITSLESQLAHTLNNTTALPSTNTPALSSNNSAPLGPISNCTSYSSPFASPRGGTFNIHCGNDLTGGLTPDLLGVYVYTFQDCINACASYNRESLRAVQEGQTQLRPNGTCFAVSWNRALTHDQGNCYLKSAIQVALSVNSTVDTATLNKES